jgi:hypothetical protein
VAIGSRAEEGHIHGDERFSRLIKRRRRKIDEGKMGERGRHVTNSDLLPRNTQEKSSGDEMRWRYGDDADESFVFSLSISFGKSALASDGAVMGSSELLTVAAEELLSS